MPPRTPASGSPGGQGSSSHRDVPGSAGRPRALAGSNPTTPGSAGRDLPSLPGSTGSTHAAGLGTSASTPKAPVHLIWKAIFDFDAKETTRADAITIKKGTMGEVISQTISGWSEIRITPTGREGWVASNRLDVFPREDLTKHMSSSIDPEKHVDYPYRAKQAFDATTVSDPGVVSINKGEEGKILAYDPSGWSRVSVGRTGTKGWVPTFCVEAGPRKWGDMKIEHDFPNTTSANITKSDIDERKPKGLAGKLVVLLIAAIRKNQDKLPFLSHKIRKLLNDPIRRQKTVRDLIRGVDAGYEAVLSDPNSTIDDIRRNIRNVKSKDVRTGHYFRITSDFDDDRDPEGYTGMTAAQGFGPRSEGHRFAGHNYKGFNASSISSRDAGKLTLHPICVMSNKDLDAILLGEQVWMLVNGSYRSSYYDHLHKISLKAEVNSEDLTTEITQNVIRDISYKESAAVLISVADAVFKEIGFQPLCRRKSFGAHDGLNCKSPVRENDHHEKTLWTRLVQPGVKEVYYREGMEIIKDKSNSSYNVEFMGLYAEDGNKRPVVVQFPSGKPRPPLGTIIYPVWEIMVNGEPHHTPWARLNEIGCYPNWRDANKLALRVQWEENGVWQSMYQQVGRLAQFEDTEEPGCVTPYNRAMAIIRFLKQRVQADPPSWYVDGGIARVKSLTFDNFTQTIHIKDLAPSDKLVPRPRLKTVAEMADELTKLGCLNVGGEWGKHALRPGDKFVKDHQNQKNIQCDACNIMKLFVGETRRKNALYDWPCKRIVDANGNETDTCQNCHKRGLRVCSWTRPESITPEMIRAINYKGVGPGAATMNEPLEFVMEDDSDEDNDEDNDEGSDED